MPETVSDEPDSVSDLMAQLYESMKVTAVERDKEKATPENILARLERIEARLNLNDARH